MTDAINLNVINDDITYEVTVYSGTLVYYIKLQANYKGAIGILEKRLQNSQGIFMDDNNTVGYYNLKSGDTVIAISK